MAWDKDNPDGQKALRQGDDRIRENNAALETALDAEHAFSTGGDQSGRHKFLRDTEGIADSSSDWVVGSLYFNADDILAGLTLPRVCASVGPVVWEHVWPFNQWPALTHFHEWVSKSGTPITWTGEEGHYFESELTADTTVDFPSYPTVPVSGLATSYTWRFKQPAAGQTWTITFSGNYRWQQGIAPVMPTGNSELLLVTLTKAPDDYLEGTWVADIS